MKANPLIEARKTFSLENKVFILFFYKNISEKEQCDYMQHSEGKKKV